jgi:hypothetical protein
MISFFNTVRMQLTASVEKMGSPEKSEIVQTLWWARQYKTAKKAIHYPTRQTDRKLICI